MKLMKKSFYKKQTLIMNRSLKTNSPFYIFINLKTKSREREKPL